MVEHKLMQNHKRWEQVLHKRQSGRPATEFLRSVTSAAVHAKSKLRLDKSGDERASKRAANIVNSRLGHLNLETSKSPAGPGGEAESQSDSEMDAEASARPSRRRSYSCPAVLTPSLLIADTDDDDQRCPPAPAQQSAAEGRVPKRRRFGRMSTNRIGELLGRRSQPRARPCSHRRLSAPVLIDYLPASAPSATATRSGQAPSAPRGTTPGPMASSSKRVAPAFPTRSRVDTPGGEDEKRGGAK